MTPKQSFNPETDRAIYQKYNKKTLQNKIENKLALQSEFGLVNNKKSLLCAVTIPLTAELQGDILAKLIEGMVNIDIQLVLLGIGTKSYQTFFTKIASEHPYLIKILPPTEENKRKIYAASDAGLILSDKKECIEELEHYLQYATIPICHKAAAQQFHLLNYQPHTEEGEAFIFEELNLWQIFASIVRARETYYFPYDWKNIQRSTLEKIATTGDDQE